MSSDNSNKKDDGTNDGEGRRTGLVLIGVVLGILIISGLAILYASTLGEIPVQEAAASVDADINRTDRTITITLTDLRLCSSTDMVSCSDYVLLYEKNLTPRVQVDGEYKKAAIVLDELGDSVKLEMHGNKGFINKRGEIVITVVAVEEKGKMYSPVWTEDTSYSNESLKGIPYLGDSNRLDNSAATTVRIIEYDFTEGREKQKEGSRSGIAPYG